MSLRRADACPRAPRLRGLCVLGGAALAKAEPCGLTEQGDGHVRSFKKQRMTKMLCSSELIAFVHQGQQVATLGSGRFGTVSAYRRDGEGGELLIAIKKYRRDGPALARAERIIEERNSLQQVGHGNPYVVHLLGTVKDDDYLYFALSPILGGPLHKHVLRAAGKIGLHAVRSMAAEVLCALRHLAKHGVVHRDVKLSNVLLNERGHVVLCDFSSAKWIRENNDCTHLVDLKTTHTITGSTHSMAPEMLSGMGHSFPVDWWALGILVHEMITGEPFPWNRPSRGSDASVVLLEKAAVKALLESDEEEPEDILGCWKCVEITPSIFGHELYNFGGARDLVSLLLTTRPDHRWGRLLDRGSFPLRVCSFFDALERHPFFEQVDWNAVHAGTCPPSYPDFDRRLGFLELIRSCPQQQEADISPEDQALFAIF